MCNRPYPIEKLPKRIIFIDPAGCGSAVVTLHYSDGTIKILDELLKGLDQFGTYALIRARQKLIYPPIPKTTEEIQEDLNKKVKITDVKNDKDGNTIIKGEEKEKTLTIKCGSNIDLWVVSIGEKCIDFGSYKSNNYHSLHSSSNRREDQIRAIYAKNNCNKLLVSQAYGGCYTNIYFRSKGIHTDILYEKNIDKNVDWDTLESLLGYANVSQKEKDKILKGEEKEEK